jgi:hypothetical protein
MACKEIKIPNLWDVPNEERDALVRKCALDLKCVIAEFGYLNHGRELEEDDNGHEYDYYIVDVDNLTDIVNDIMHYINPSRMMLFGETLFRVHYDPSDKTPCKDKNKKYAGGWSCGCVKCACGTSKLLTMKTGFCNGWHCGCSDESRYVRLSDEKVAKVVYDMIMKKKEEEKK